MKNRTQFLGIAVRSLFKTTVSSRTDTADADGKLGIIVLGGFAAAKEIFDGAGFEGKAHAATDAAEGFARIDVFAYDFAE